MTLPMSAFKFYMPRLIASRATDGTMRLEGVASSTVRDHHGDAISLKALRKMAAVAEGMVVFMNHSYDVPKDVFGTVEKAMIHKTGEKDVRTGEDIYDLRTGIKVAASNDQAVRTFELIETDKVKLGISIGAMLPEGGYTLDKTDGGRLLIDDIDLVEASVVSIPANPRAFVDYAVKSVFGAFPTLFDGTTHTKNNPKFAASRVATMEKLASGGLLPDEEQEGEGTGEEMDGLELEPGQVGELTVNEDGTSSARVVDESEDDGSGLPESADGADIKERKLEPGQKLAAAEPPAGSTAEPVEAGDLQPAEEDALHNLIGEPMVDSEEHPALTKGKTHQHPHAHVHGHEHQHGYGDTVTTHKHEHAHQHSHDHGADHDHADTMDDYGHNHPHNGSWDNEDHAHGDGAVKADPEPTVRKSTVTVWESADGSTTTEVNTGRKRAKADENQSVQDSLEPETTGGSPGAEAAEQVIVASADPVDEEILVTLKALVAKTHSDTGSALKAAIGALTASRQQVTDLRTERVLLLEMSKNLIEGTKEILIRVGRLPASRKTFEYGEIQNDFGDLADIYSEDVRKAFKSKRS